ncbi:TPR repeat-containing protein YfgC precursor [Roseivivax jejudonensis]|uniref:TPR repeat-containing protein YfgC n=1 Tax=Roseivivax jejudonensis TaxID=1529041 RepID=A0A1X6ZCU7_9RHOB|nr:M48 family metallopeptidase [Roseivivax jejudonensis]SLN47228.1 TPR repeat-containing protein YfgC precursor [Roseivivax jejudonensis]
MPCTCFSTAPTLSRRRLLTGAAALPLATLPACDRARVLVSEQEAAAMGAEAWQQIRSEVPESDDSAFRDTVATLSERLITAAGGDPGAWQVVAFEAPEVNAFALPGGRIGVYRGLYDLAGSPDELAAVIGHEIGHLEADHARERMGNARAQGALQRLVAFVLRQSEIEFDEEIMAALGLGLRYGLALPYGRDQELEADRLGLDIMTDAGFAPDAAIRLWERMEAARPDRPPAFLATHPAPGTRIRALREMIET